MAYLLQHVIALLLLAVVIWLPGWLLGRSTLEVVSPALRPLARIILGLGFWIACIFVLAACGLLRPAVLWALIGGVIAACVGAWLRAGRPIARFHRPSTASILASVALAAVLTPLALLALTPTVSWDASAYHLTLPRLFLDHGGFRDVPFNVYAAWPLNVQLLFALAMAIQDFVLAKLLHFALGLAVLYALVAGCRAFHRPASGVLAALLFLANGVVILEMRVAYVDLGHALFLLAGVLFMIEALEHDRRTLWLSGLCCGLAAGTKLTGVVGAGIVATLYLPHLIRHGESALKPFLTRFVTPVVILWTPWVAYTAILTGNPAYPFLHGWFGGPDWGPALSDQLRTWQSSIGMGREPIDYLLLPLRVSLAGDQGYERFDGASAAFWIVLFPLALWFAWRWAPGRARVLVRQCLVISVLYFIFWSLSSQQMRLLIPMLPILAIACAVALVEILGRLPERWRRAGVAAAFVVTAASLVAGQAPVLAAGYRTLAVYLRAPGDLKATAVHPVYSFVNDQLPPNAKLLFLNTNQRFFCQREVLADSFFEASQITAWLAPASDATAVSGLLADRGVTHILAEHRFRGATYPETLLELLRDPELAKPIYRSPDGRFSVFELAATATLRR